MLRPLTLTLALLAAGPALADSTSRSACNDQSAELSTTAAGTTLTVNGTEVALDPGFTYTGLSCIGRDGETSFGLIRSSGDTEEYLLLDPETLETTEIPYDEAEALHFWDTEDDWFDDE
jgi:hypothetical protein